MIIRPFNAVFFAVMALVAALALGLKHFAQTHSRSRSRALLTAICACNIVFFFIYKGFLSVDPEFLAVSGQEKFNWFSELPLQLCNINMFLIPIGMLTNRKSVMGFSFYVAPLGAMMAMLFPESAFTGYSLLLPRILGFYGTHALLVACGLSLAGMDFYQPSMKEAPRVLGVYVTLTLAAHALNMILRATVCPEANYFYTYGADISVLNLFWRMIPHPLLYELPAPLLLLGYMALVQMLRSGLSRAAQRREARA